MKKAATANTIAHRLYNLSRDFFESALILQESKGTGAITDSVDAPEMFLRRHALELAIKSEIFKTKGSEKITGLDIPIEVSINKTNPLDSTHSIVKLIFAFTGLASCINEQDKCALMKLAADVDSVDASSDFFRYPYGKRARKEEKGLKLNSRIIMNISEPTSIIPELKPSGRMVIATDGNNVAIMKSYNRKLEKAIYSMDKLLKCFYHLSEFDRFGQLSLSEILEN
jgi:hypothetical protein